MQISRIILKKSSFNGLNAKKTKIKGLLIKSKSLGYPFEQTRRLSNVVATARCFK
jgi:hypothetical protein